MIQHVRIGDERARSEAADVETEVAAAHAHARPLELLKGGHLTKGRIEVADHAIVALYRLVPLLHLHPRICFTRIQRKLPKCTMIVCVCVWS